MVVPDGINIGVLETNVDVNYVDAFFQIDNTTGAEYVITWRWSIGVVSPFPFLLDAGEKNVFVQPGSSEVVGISSNDAASDLDIPPGEEWEVDICATLEDAETVGF